MIDWKRLRRCLLLLAGLLCADGIAACLLLYTGLAWFNTPSRDAFPVRGVDVSSYQGEIDWPVLAGQELDFAYIKATEGSGSTDPTFAFNWENARRTALAVGAYHFFSFDSAGKTQADNFLAVAPPQEGTLPPAVDVEFYGGNEANPPAPDGVRRELQILLDRLEAAHGRKPVLYATMASYRLYLDGAFDGYPLWIRDVLHPPRLPEGRRWTIWQYSPRGRLDGYRGRECFIDLNVFTGSREDFAAFLGEAA